MSLFFCAYFCKLIFSHLIRPIMRYNEKKKAVLLLRDGTIFRGNAAGFQGTTHGEIAFNTGMTGYQEIFTDPSYLKQVIVMTTSHIGNYGTAPAEVESDSVKISGMVCKKFSDIFSRESANEGLQEYLEKNRVVAISDIDTRALVTHIRDKGAMNCIISSEEDKSIEDLKTELNRVPSMEGLILADQVTTKKPFDFNISGKYKIALVDYGVKTNIARCLAERGCHVRVFPYTTPLKEMLDWGAQGFMLSNGPGDPGAMKNSILGVREIVNAGLPVFGICLGHQLLALSQNLKTEKMFNGHRGINHPVLNLITGNGEITSQNHGFVVTRESVNENEAIQITHKHLNDNTVQGIRLKDKPVFSVQYHPEASAGPHDSRYLFDDFISLIK